MSIYTYIAGNVVADLEAEFFTGTFVTRLEERENYDLQVRYYVWGGVVVDNGGLRYKDLYFEVMKNGDLFTANRYDAIYFSEFLMLNFGEEYYMKNVCHDNGCHWSIKDQEWVPVAHPEGDIDSMVQSYCDEQQGDICDNGVHPPHPDDVKLELDIIDTLDSIERLDGKFDVVELMSDGNVRMVTKDYDPLAHLPHVDRDRVMGGYVFGHRVDQLVYATDDSAGRDVRVIIDSGEKDEGNGSFTWSHYVKGVCDYLDSSVQFYLVYEDDLGRTSEMLLANDDPRIVKCSYIISLNGDIPF